MVRAHTRSRAYQLALLHHAISRRMVNLPTIIRTPEAIHVPPTCRTPALPPRVDQRHWKVIVGGNVFNFPAQGARGSMAAQYVKTWTLPGIKHAIVRTYAKDVYLFHDADCMVISRHPSEHIQLVATKTIVLYEDETIYAIGWMDEEEREQEWSIFAIDDNDIPPSITAQLPRDQYPPCDVSIALSWSRLPALLRMYLRYLHAWMPPAIRAYMNGRPLQGDIALTIEGLQDVQAPASQCLAAIVSLVKKVYEFEMLNSPFLAACPIVYMYRPYRSYNGCAYAGSVPGRTTKSMA